MVEYRFTEEKLKQILEEMYDAGWTGPLDLKESFVDDIIKTRLEEFVVAELPFATVITTNDIELEE
jgi:hypothetical protein